MYPELSRLRQHSVTEQEYDKYETIRADMIFDQILHQKQVPCRRIVTIMTTILLIRYMTFVMGPEY